MVGSGARRREGETLVNFMARFTSSEQFGKVFREGMSLVEETAAYLDGPGRRDSRRLGRHASIAYATESMRLTTRLMQLASWLLVQRAVSAGEITRQAAESESQRIDLADIGAGAGLERAEQLPAAFLALVDRSLRLHERIMLLDDMIHRAAAARAPMGSPVAHHIDRLAETFAQQKRSR
jgi:regulator of CtrA degradation